MIRSVEPAPSLVAPETLLLDVRPQRERAVGGLGFIPGSLRAPQARELHPWLLARGHAFRTKRVVSFCQSGKRSQQWLADVIDGWPIGERLPELAHLTGGVLAWTAHRLPLAGLASVGADPAADMASFRRQLKACFIAELVESQCSRGLEQAPQAPGPLAALKSCFGAASVPWEWGDSPPSPRLMADVIDHAARASAAAGTPLQVIANNIDRLLERLPWQPGEQAQ